MKKTLKVGDHVTWNSEAGQVSGILVDVMIDAEFDLDKGVWLLNFQHVDFSAGRHDDSAWRYSGICQHSDCEPLRCAAFSGPTTLG
jgi:hypothetical protein